MGLALFGCTSALPSAPTKVYRVGLLFGSTQAGAALDLDTFRGALRDLGYAEGRNLSLEVRYADGYAERDPALAAELVALQPDVLVTRQFAEALALKQATTAIPIVFAGVADPVGNGLVASMARPGGNITGIAGQDSNTAQRRLQILKEAIPGVSRVGYLFDASNPVQTGLYNEARTAGAAIGIEVRPLEVRGPGDFTDAFATAERTRPDAVFIAGGALNNSQRQRIIDFIAASHFPAIASADRVYADTGALLYFGVDVADIVKRAASYVDRIEKGAKVTDLPVEGPSRYELVVNLRTAKSLGLTIPQSVLAQATEVIQ